MPHEEFTARRLLALVSGLPNRSWRWGLRWARARELGIPIGRVRDLDLPTHLTLNGMRHAVHLPSEPGIVGAFVEILLDDCYGVGRLKGANAVLDVGANVGLFSVAARAAFPEATIHAYEPNRRLEPFLSVQSAAAGFEYFLEAVGHADGAVNLDVREDSIQTRSWEDEAGAVPQISFRGALARLGDDVDLVKVDCEGAEWSFLGDVNSWRGVRYLSIEYHLWPAHSHLEARNAVERLGFTVQQHVPVTDYGLLLGVRR